MVESEWIGLDPERFKPYKNWKNQGQPGICGTYVSAVLLDDYLHQKYNLSIEKKKLIPAMEAVVDKWMLYRGTFMWDVCHGLNYFLQSFTADRAQMHLLAEYMVPRILSSAQPRPLAVGTSRLLASSYKNHWLVVYAYRYGENGQLYFKCYDNHGRYQAVIKASQSLSCVWIGE